MGELGCLLHWLCSETQVGADKVRTEKKEIDLVVGFAGRLANEEDSLFFVEKRNPYLEVGKGLLTGLI